MADVSVGRALGAGFGVIRHHPAAVAAWAVVYILLGVLPQFGIFAILGPTWMQLLQNNGTMTPEILQAQMRVNQMQPLIWVTSIATQTLMLGAAYRAVLFPDERGFFFLRVSRRELWLGLVILVLYVGVFLGVLVAAIPIGVVVAILSLATGSGGVGAGVGIFVAITALMVVIVWLGLRFSLGPPMSFAERGFRLFESWSATRGHAWPMFLTALVIVLIALAIEIVVMLIAFLALGGVAGVANLGQTIRSGGFNMAAILPAAVGGGVILALLGAVVYALFGGAWAQIYRDLNPKPEEVFS